MLDREGRFKKIYPLLINETEELGTTNMKKAEVLNIFVSVLNVNLSSHIPQDPETQGRDWGNKVFCTVGES